MAGSDSIFVSNLSPEEYLELVDKGRSAVLKISECCMNGCEINDPMLEEYSADLALGVDPADLLVSWGEFSRSMEENFY